MRTHLALIGLGLSIVAGRGLAVSPQVQALYEDCQDGHRQSCRQLYKLARRACVQGDPSGCQFAENMNGEIKDDNEPPKRQGSVTETSAEGKKNCLGSKSGTQRQTFNDCR
jgi:hypothetical protein